MRQTKENTALVKRRILETATAEFARHGFAAVNLEEIATIAGVSRGPLYYHFKSKEALYIACVETLVAQEQAIYETILDETKYVLTLLRDDLTFCLSNRRLEPFYCSGKDGAPETSIFHEYYAWLHERKTAALTAAKARGELREDCDIPELLTFLYIYIWGMVRANGTDTGFPLSNRVIGNSTEYFIQIIRQKYCP